MARDRQVNRHPTSDTGTRAERRPVPEAGHARRPPALLATSRRSRLGGRGALMTDPIPTADQAQDPREIGSAKVAPPVQPSTAGAPANAPPKPTKPPDYARH